MVDGREVGAWSEVAPGVQVLVGDEVSRTARRVRESIGTGEILRCVYFGGRSAPGRERPIVPLSIDGPYVWARCLNSGQRKRYLIGKMRIVEEGQALSDVGPPEGARAAPARRPPPVRALSDVVERHGDALEAQGWQCIATEEALSIFLVSDAGVRAEIGLGFDEVRREWVVARKGRRRIYRSTLKGATTQFLRFAEMEARAPLAGAPTARSPNWRLALAAVSALFVGVLLGLWLG